eukprot:scaffold3950_cov100-Skeletonema_dohrnii-CCMP3373.AAC.3
MGAKDFDCGYLGRWAGRSSSREGCIVNNNMSSRMRPFQAADLSYCVEYEPTDEHSSIQCVVVR